MIAFVVRHWKVLLAITLTLLVVGFILSYMNMYYEAKNAVPLAEARQAAKEAHEQKEQADKNIAALTVRQVDLEKEKTRLETEAKALEGKVMEQDAALVALAKERDDAVFVLRQLDTTDELEARFGKNFPEVIHDIGFGIRDIMDDDGNPIPYMVIPAWFAQVFIEDHEGIANLQQQLEISGGIEDILKRLVAMKERINMQSEKIGELSEDKFRVADEARNACDARFDKANDALITEYKRPKFQLPSGWSLGLCLGAGAGGAYLLDKWVR